MDGTKIAAKVGFFSVGLDTYWAQFKGLRDRLLGYHAEIAGRLAAKAEVVDAGLVDTPDKARSASRTFADADIDVVFLFVATYALSSTVLPAIPKGAFVVVLNVQPVARLDYDAFNALGDRGAMTGVWLEHCQSCSAPEIACVFNRSGVRYAFVTGYLKDEGVWSGVSDWLDAARVVAGMRANRMGVLGHYYCGMLDVYSDLTAFSSTFGTHVEILEMCELKALRDRVTPDETAAKVAEFRERFDVSAECSADELDFLFLSSLNNRNLRVAFDCDFGCVLGDFFVLFGSGLVLFAKRKSALFNGFADCHSRCRLDLGFCAAVVNRDGYSLCRARRKRERKAANQHKAGCDFCNFFHTHYPPIS